MGVLGEMVVEGQDCQKQTHRGLCGQDDEVVGVGCPIHQQL